MPNHIQINKEVNQAIRREIEETPTASRSDTPPSKDTVSIFGLGYVGIVSSVCLGKMGVEVIGVDTNPETVHSLNRGISPIVEPGLEELILEGLEKKVFCATTDTARAVKMSDISFVCVGTPSTPEGALDLKYLKQVSRDIGENLKNKTSHHTIVYRSTMEPGTAEKILTPILQKSSGKIVNEDFSVCFHPEFLREGTAIDDFFAPPKTVVGTLDRTAAQKVLNLYGDHIQENIVVTSLEVAEMVKYVDNTWHALKVAFANEIGRICQVCETDGHDVMEIFCKDRKLNLSPYYLKPGFAFGGSCLPKDVRGINKLASNAKIETPLLNSILASNEIQIDHAVKMVRETGNLNIAILGLTFKRGTDDLRETPTIPLIAKLLGQGCHIKVYDANIKNKKPLLHYLQHAECADPAVVDFCNNFEKYQASSFGEVLKGAGTIVITHDSDIFKEIAAQRTDEQAVVDLVRLFKSKTGPKEIFDAGMDNYLQKPARSHQLKTMLNKHMSSSFVPNKKRVLLAEDNIPMNTVIQLKLSALGYNVDTVTNGEDAVTMATNKIYDAILMDLHMPKMDGYEATRQIRQLKSSHASVPIIALSATAAPEQSISYHGLCW